MSERLWTPCAIIENAVVEQMLARAVVPSAPPRETRARRRSGNAAYRVSAALPGACVSIAHWAADQRVKIRMPECR